MNTQHAITTDVTYFLEPGPTNTDMTLNLSVKRANTLGIKTIIVASTRGRTGLRAAELCTGHNLIVVTHSTGFTENNSQELSGEDREKLLAAGATVLTCQHAFGGVGRAVRKKLGTYELEELMAYTLRIFGQGTKVACEVALMATDAGLARTDEEVISIAGTDSGADTALVLQPANAQSLFDLRIKEIICKPRL
jgi:hypothetical protein